MKQVSVPIRVQQFWFQFNRSAIKAKIFGRGKFQLYAVNPVIDSTVKLA